MIASSLDGPPQVHQQVWKSTNLTRHMMKQVENLTKLKSRMIEKESNYLKIGIVASAEWASIADLGF
jgi:hypothetical protein